MAENNTKEPLVSVGILSYNSSKTILETLESVKAQTYKNIELIISDDASKDNTVEVCRKWIEENKARFVRCEILTVPENTGIPANANRRIAASRGVWSKGVAADDILAPDCIENFVNYVNENLQAEIVFAKFQEFKDVFDKKNFLLVKDCRAKWFCESLDTPQKQFKKLLGNYYCHACTMFAKLDLLKRIKYDEEFKGIEDYPMWLRLTKSGVRFHFMDSVVVYYRHSSSSISGHNGSLGRFLSFWLKMEPFKAKYIYPEKSAFYRFMRRARRCQVALLKKAGLINPDNSRGRDAVLAFFYYLMSPHLVLKKIIGKFRS
ncbi:MAG: glycosyltransferase [Opitutales bacterium]|nr:glycosyltransferase [Opitutales bacterium]